MDTIDVPTNSIQASRATHNEQITKAAFPILSREINHPTRNADPQVNIKGRKLQTSKWTQLGLGIVGEAAYDFSSYSISLSSNGNILAIGAPYNDPSSGRTNAGHVRVFNFNGTGWTQLGADIDGKSTGDNSGYSVSLSSNGTVLAIGAPGNDPSSGRTDAGHVQVYNFNGTYWTQLGVDIDGETAGEASGYSVSLSGDGSVLAVGAPYSDPKSGNNAGRVRVYNFNGTGWTQLGLSIDGEAAGDLSGISASLSSDGTVLAVGAPYNDPSSDRADAGHVRVYNFNGTGWTQLGVDIDGEAAGDLSGITASLSSNGTVVAIGALLNDPSSRTNAGHARVYNFNGTSWTQLGLDIDGEATGDSSGGALSLSSDGSVLAVGAVYNDPSSGRPDAGHVRVYNFNGTDWTQLGLDIDGETPYNSFGGSVSISSDGSVLAVGAVYYFPSSGRFYAGQVQVYQVRHVRCHSISLIFYLQTQTTNLIGC